MTSRMQRILLLALLIDVVYGDPPNRYHPVAWMGSVITWLRRHAPMHGPRQQLAYGALISPLAALSVGGLGGLLHYGVRALPGDCGWIIEALALKSTFAWNGLDAAAAAIALALRAGDLPAARRHLSWHLVSRPTEHLTAAAVAAATVESVAENASDGLIAPLLAYALGGLPAALAYRFANTADAMVGYHDATHEWLGKIPARTDDVLNLVPARLTALLLILATVLTRDDTRQAWAIWRRDAHLTASPNAGQPMSVMAGALRLELAKAGHYVLGQGQREADVDDIAHARRLVRWMMVICASSLLILKGYQHNA